MLTDKLDPASGSVVAEVKKNNHELRAKLEQRFSSIARDLKCSQGF